MLWCRLLLIQSIEIVVVCVVVLSLGLVCIAHMGIFTGSFFSFSIVFRIEKEITFLFYKNILYAEYLIRFVAHRAHIPVSTS